MKPLLDDFNPEVTTAYDDCLKGIPNAQYLERASEVKLEYGISTFALLYSVSDNEMRNLMIEHDVQAPSVSN